MKKLLWRWLNSLRVWMVHKRLPARYINAVSAICVRIRRMVDDEG